MNPIKIVFLGTPEFACPALQKLIDDPRFEISAVITQEDKPVGRKQELSPSPVKTLALKNSLRLFQPIKLSKDREIIEKIKAIAPDFLVVVAYGQIVSQEILNIPKIKPINIHGSILPLYRGASPIEQTLLNNDQYAGISIMEMTLKMDQGPVYEIHKLLIAEHDNNLTLRDKLSHLGAEKLPDCLIKIFNGELKPEPQNESGATYCQKISKEDGLIKPQEETVNQILGKLKAFTPWPGIYLDLNGKKLKIVQAVKTTNPSINPGSFVTTKNQIFLNCLDFQLEVLELQLEGKKSLLANVFLLGNASLLK